METTDRMKVITRSEELKQLLWDRKLMDEVQALCEMVNPTVSASLVQSITAAFEKRIKWAVELEKLEPGVKVFNVPMEERR